MAPAPHPGLVRAGGAGLFGIDDLGPAAWVVAPISNFVKYGLYEKGDIRNSNYNIHRVMWYNKLGFQKEVGIDAKGQQE